MFKILGYKYKLSDIPKNWEHTHRQCGMNNILWIDSRYPSRKEVYEIETRLSSNECCVIFNGNDKPVAMYKGN